jgi:hypothetical protein
MARGGFIPIGRCDRLDRGSVEHVPAVARMTAGATSRFAAREPR